MIEIEHANRLKRTGSYCEVGVWRVGQAHVQLERGTCGTETQIEAVKNAITGRDE
jgi:hypothetical protein